MRRSHWATVSVCALSLPAAGFGQWITFADQTGARSNVAAGLFANDPEEKDYAWGDLDRDGDLDLVVARKAKFTVYGPKQQLLLMNENGVLVDRTAQWATAVFDVPGDQGFLTPANNRDIAIADVNGDGWPDVITAVAMGTNQGKAITHPRIYMNLGVNGANQWQGLRFENFRFPTLVGGVPSFCSVWADDADQDGDTDLFFVDYDSGPSSGDTNDRLLLNNGNGTFFDASNPTFFQNTSWLGSAFGTRGQIVDLNGDGKRDLLKVNTLGGPGAQAIYSSSTQNGFFNRFQEVNGNAVYFATAGDLNNDNLTDIVITSDNTDQYMINNGNSAAGTVNWVTFNMPSQTGGFGANSVIADLDNDGLKDVIIVDVDVDIPGCGGITDILRNKGTPLSNLFSYQSNAVSIGEGNLTGVHDVAVFDINDDGCLDIVVGSCTASRIWVQQNCVAICEGDLDGDGDRDDSDLGILLASFGVNAGGDIDGDNDTDDSDLGILLSGFGVPCGS